MNARSAPTLGILGGMGPVATADFLLRLARLTPAGRDQDHLPTIVYSDPATPDRSDAILGQGPSPLPALLQGTGFLNQAGCALIAIPCNSAHHWYDALCERSSAPIVHIADATAAEILDRSDVRTIGILATDGAIRSGMYASRLEASGVATVDLRDLGDASPAMRGIRAMKAGDQPAARDALRRAADILVRRGAQALVLGCTDVSAALSGGEPVGGVPVFDAADCLARACIKGLGRQPHNTAVC